MFKTLCTRYGIDLDLLIIIGHLCLIFFLFLVSMYVYIALLTIVHQCLLSESVHPSYTFKTRDVHLQKLFHNRLRAPTIDKRFFEFNPVAFDIKNPNEDADTARFYHFSPFVSLPKVEEIDTPIPPRRKLGAFKSGYMIGNEAPKVSRFNATTDFVHHVYISLWLIPCYIYVDVQRMLNSYSVVILADFIVYSLFHCCKNRTYSATCLCRCSISAYLNTRTVKKGIIYLPIWREKTWKSGHVTVLDFLVSTQRCKISDTRIFSPI